MGPSSFTKIDKAYWVPLAAYFSSHLLRSITRKASRLCNSTTPAANWCPTPLHFIHFHCVATAVLTAT